MWILIVFLLIISLGVIFAKPVIEKLTDYQKCRRSGFSGSFCSQPSLRYGRNCICGDGSVGYRKHGWRGRCVCGTESHYGHHGHGRRHRRHRRHHRWAVPFRWWQWY